MCVDPECQTSGCRVQRRLALMAQGALPMPSTDGTDGRRTLGSPVGNNPARPGKRRYGRR